MIDLNGKVKLGDLFYSADGKPADFNFGTPSLRRTVSNFIGATYQQMLDQGWYLYIAQVVPATHKVTGTIIIDVDHATQEIVAKTPAEIDAELSELKITLRGYVDLAIDTARSTYVSRGAFIIHEYKIAFEEAVVWKSEEPTMSSLPVPPAILSWSEAKAVTGGMTPEEACQDILDSGGSLTAMVIYTRDIRLKQKEAISAAGTAAEAQAIHDAVIASLSL